MFKFVAVLALAAAVSCDVSHLLRKPSSYQPGQEASANILRQDSDIQPDGSYRWSYETDNAIAAQEEGRIQQQGPENVIKSVQGSFSYNSPEGIPVNVAYVADENGFQPQGDLLPTPHPIPADIQRALDWIASHPAAPEKRF